MAYTFSKTLLSIVKDYYNYSGYLVVESLLIGEVVLFTLVLVVAFLLSGVFFLKKSVILGVLTIYLGYLA